eukprot:8832954-Pyramimonas_sp.AAC.1
MPDGGRRSSSSGTRRNMSRASPGCIGDVAMQALVPRVPPRKFLQGCSSLCREPPPLEGREPPPGLPGWAGGRS